MKNVMKNVVIALAAVLVLFGAAAPAQAAFDYGANSSLTLSIYNPDTNIETGYDLGILGADFTLADQGRSMGTVDVSDLASDVALYSATSAWQTFVGINEVVAPVISTSAIITQQGATREIFNTYGDVSPVTIPGTTNNGKTATGHFGDTGSYKGFIVTGGSQPGLAPLAADSFFDIYLYQYDGGVLNKGFDATTDYAAVIRIDDAGGVTLNPVPVPAAVWLLGSGLLGLVGIRRRNS